MYCAARRRRSSQNAQGRGTVRERVPASLGRSDQRGRAVSGDSVWELVGGGEILFAHTVDGVMAEHQSRSGGSSGYIGTLPSLEAAELKATAWLRNAGLRRAPR